MNVIARVLALVAVAFSVLRSARTPRTWVRDERLAERLDDERLTQIEKALAEVAQFERRQVEVLHAITDLVEDALRASTARGGRVMGGPRPLPLFHLTLATRATRTSCAMNTTDLDVRDDRPT